jgi:hypothetical protein
MAVKNRQSIIFIDGESYYTAQKAQEVLNMTYSGLKYQVMIGNIKSEIPKGRRQSYYHGKDVEQVAKDIKSLSLYRRNKPTQFSSVKTREEMIVCQEISQALFGVGRDMVDERMEILERNPYTYYMLKDEDQIIGYTAIWPVKPGKLHSLLAQTIPVKVLPEDVEIFESSKNIDIYIDVMGVKPNFTREEKRLYASRLIAGIIEVVINLGERGISIGVIAARSSLPEGVRLLKGIGFAEIEPLTPERRTFIIEVGKSGISYIVDYKSKLNAWKEEHS